MFYWKLCSFLFFFKKKNRKNLLFYKPFIMNFIDGMFSLHCCLLMFVHVYHICGWRICRLFILKKKNVSFLYSNNVLKNYSFYILVEWEQFLKNILKYYINCWMIIFYFVLIYKLFCFFFKKKKLKKIQFFKNIFLFIYCGVVVIIL